MVVGGGPTCTGASCVSALREDPSLAVVVRLIRRPKMSVGGAIIISVQAKQSRKPPTGSSLMLSFLWYWFGCSFGHLNSIMLCRRWVGEKITLL